MAETIKFVGKKRLILLIYGKTVSLVIFEIFDWKYEGNFHPFFSTSMITNKKKDVRAKYFFEICQISSKSVVNTSRTIFLPEYRIKVVFTHLTSIIPDLKKKKTCVKYFFKNCHI